MTEKTGEVVVCEVKAVAYEVAYKVATVAHEDSNSVVREDLEAAWATTETVVMEVTVLSKETLGC